MTVLTLVVAAGGVSAERDISLKTGHAVARALTGRGHRVTLVDLREESAAPLLSVAPRPSVVFIALHGGFGEDGRLQTQLELANMPYTGPGPLACRLAMDKERAKKLFTAQGVPTPPGCGVDRTDAAEWVSAMAQRHGWPLVVKPTCEGSSVGVTLVNDVTKAEVALNEAFRHGPRALIERCIVGRELTVSILDGRVLPLIEIRTRRAFFDFEAKYKSRETEYIVKPPLRPDLHAAVEQAAANAYKALDCRGLARVDVMVSEREGPFVLEVNAIPGMTETSLAPKAAAAAGMSFADLCEAIVASALTPSALTPGGVAEPVVFATASR